MGKSHLVVMFTVGPDDVPEGDRIFASHAEWMKGHSREGDVALLIDEYYESPAGIARHWQDAMDNWPDMSAAVPAWSAKATVVTLHNGTAVQALW